MKAIAGSSWGFMTETLVATYKAIVHPILSEPPYLVHSSVLFSPRQSWSDLLQEGELGVGRRAEGREIRLGGEERGGGQGRGAVGGGLGAGLLWLMALLLVVTWNVRRLSVRETKRRRLRSVAERVRQERWEMVLLTVLRADEEGVVWLGEDEESVVLIHAREFVCKWKGARKGEWWSNRDTIRLYAVCRWYDCGGNKRGDGWKCDAYERGHGQVEGEE